MFTNLSNAVDRWTHGTVMGGFTLDAGYYAGRPPSPSDISTATLQGIYQGLKDEVSPEAALNFVRFVRSLKDMSASSFIIAFQRFAQSDFVLVEVAQHPDDRESGVRNEGQAFAVMADKLGGSESEDRIRRASESLKKEFLRQHELNLA